MDLTFNSYARDGVISFESIGDIVEGMGILAGVPIEEAQSWVKDCFVPEADFGAFCSIIGFLTEKAAFFQKSSENLIDADEPPEYFPLEIDAVYNGLVRGVSRIGALAVCRRLNLPQACASHLEELSVPATEARDSNAFKRQFWGTLAHCGLLCFPSSPHVVAQELVYELVRTNLDLLSAGGSGRP